MEWAVIDFLILGFLMRGPKSGYDIKRLMAMSTAHFYETSFGSIYPSLARMEGCGYVKAERADASRRLRMAYEILPAGREAFLEWLASPLDIAKGPSFLLARLFFLGLLPSTEAARAITSFREAAKRRREWLETATDGLSVKPDFFQASTQAFGLEYYAFLESWLDGLCGKAAKNRKRASAQAKAKEKP
jgi:DNA-binding PadR family transcriptional regulator